MAKSFEFDIAISFAGENRELGRKFAEKLLYLDVSVFFDELYESNLLGKTLSKYFREVFNEKCRFVLAILDRHHQEKIRPTFERDTFDV